MFKGSTFPNTTRSILTHLCQQYQGYQNIWPHLSVIHRRKAPGHTGSAYVKHGDSLKNLALNEYYPHDKSKQWGRKVALAGVLGCSWWKQEIAWWCWWLRGRLESTNPAEESCQLTRTKPELHSALNQPSIVTEVGNNDEWGNADVIDWCQKEGNLEGNDGGRLERADQHRE